jgi:integrase
MKGRRERSTSRLIFSGTSGKTEVHFLRVLKRLAFRAGLNCGNCFDKKGRCCAKRANCKQFGLHRFRKTFATMHHEAGVSAWTIQRWLRHSSLETTLRYLAGSDDQSDRTRSVVNSTFAGRRVLSRAWSICARLRRILQRSTSDLPARDPVRSGHRRTRDCAHALGPHPLLDTLPKISTSF